MASRFSMTKINGHLKWIVPLCILGVSAAVGYINLRQVVNDNATHHSNLETQVTTQYRDLQREMDGLRADIRILLNR